MKVRLFTLLLSIGLLAAACSEEPAQSAAEEHNAEIAEANIDTLLAAEPPARVSHPMTRKTINFWLEAWDVPDKVSYVYIVADTGSVLGYFVSIGLPVSYCVGLEDPVEYDKLRRNGTDFVFQAPRQSQDGVYYGGCDANTRYFKTADTGAFVEVSGLNTFVSDQPIDLGVPELILLGEGENPTPSSTGVEDGVAE